MPHWQIESSVIDPHGLNTPLDVATVREQLEESAIIERCEKFFTCAPAASDDEHSDFGSGPDSEYQSEYQSGSDDSTTDDSSGDSDDGGSGSGGAGAGAMVVARARPSRPTARAEQVARLFERRRRRALAGVAQALLLPPSACAEVKHEDLCDGPAHQRRRGSLNAGAGTDEGDDRAESAGEGDQEDEEAYDEEFEEQDEEHEDDSTGCDVLPGLSDSEEHYSPETRSLLTRVPPVRDFELQSAEASRRKAMRNRPHDAGRAAEPLGSVMRYMHHLQRNNQLLCPRVAVRALAEQEQGEEATLSTNRVVLTRVAVSALHHALEHEMLRALSPSRPHAHVLACGAESMAWAGSAASMRMLRGAVSLAPQPMATTPLSSTLIAENNACAGAGAGAGAGEGAGAGMTAGGYAQLYIADNVLANANRELVLAEEASGALRVASAAQAMAGAAAAAVAAGRRTGRSGATMVDGRTTADGAGGAALVTPTNPSVPTMTAVGEPSATAVNNCIGHKRELSTVTKHASGEPELAKRLRYDDDSGGRHRQQNACGQPQQHQQSHFAQLQTRIAALEAELATYRGHQ
eukprot:g415.t1